MKREADRRNREVDWSVEVVTELAPHLKQVFDRYTFDELLDYDDEQVLYRCTASAREAGEDADDVVIARYFRADPDRTADWVSKRTTRLNPEIVPRQEPLLRLPNGAHVPYRTVANTTLARVLSHRSRISLDARLELFSMVVKHVAALHTARQAHGDLRPINVLVSQADREDAQFLKVELLPGIGFVSDGTAIYSEANQRWLEGKVDDADRADIFSCGKIAQLLFDTLEPDSVVGCMVQHIVDRCRAGAGYDAEALRNDTEVLRSIEFMAGKETFRGTHKFRKFLASGTEGVVFSAENIEKKDRVAIKILKRTPPARQLALFTAKTLCNVRSDVLVPIRDAETRNGVSYEEMELLEGETLAVAAQNRGSDLQLLDIGMDVALACLVLHFQGHSEIDLSTNNIFLCRTDGRAKLLDYRATPRTTELDLPRAKKLTSAFISPEVRDGHGAGAMSDVYSLGVILRLMIERRAAVPAHVTDACKTLVEQATSSSVNARPDMVSVYFGLRRLKELQPAPPPPKDTRVRPFWRVFALMLASALICVGVAGAALLVHERNAVDVAGDREAKERNAKESALTEVTTATREKDALEKKNHELQEIIAKSNAPDETKRALCREAKDFPTLEADGCLLFTDSDIVERAGKLRLEHVKALELKAGGIGIKAVVAAEELMRVDPKNLVGIRTLLSQPPGPRTCRPYLAAVDQLAVEKIPLSDDLTKRAQAWRVACAGGAERQALLADAFANQGDSTALITLLLSDPDQGVLLMSNKNVNERVQCALLASAVTTLSDPSGRNADDHQPTKEKLASHMERLKCTGPADLAIYGGPHNAKVRICPKGDPNNRGCASEPLPYSAPPHKFETFTEYEAYVWWISNGQQVSTEPITITLVSGQINRYYVRSLQVQKQGHGDGTVTVEVEGFQPKQHCDQDLCGYLVHSSSLGATITAAETGTSEFAGWTDIPGCKTKRCALDLAQDAPVILRPVFTAPPIVVIDGDPAAVQIDGVASCGKKECDLTVGDHKITSTNPKKRVTGSCAQAETGCVVNAKRDGRYLVKLEDVPDVAAGTPSEGPTHP